MRNLLYRRDHLAVLAAKARFVCVVSMYADSSLR